MLLQLDRGQLCICMYKFVKYESEIKGEKMNARSFVTMLALLWMAVPNNLNAQVGSFEDLILDGGVGGSPFISFEQLDGGSHFLGSSDEQLFFFVSNGFKFIINESADDAALVLDNLGVNIQNRLNVDLTDSNFTIPVVNAFHPDTEQTFSVVSSRDGGFFGEGGIGFSTDSNGIPFFVFDSAPTLSLTVGETGVGVGTQDADAPLHVFSNSSPAFGFPEARVLVENDLPVVAIREMFSLVNNGGSRFSFRDTNLDSAWSFASDSSGRFSISINDTGGPEFVIQPDGRVLIGPGPQRNFDLRPSGNLFLTGTLFQSSDENLKTAFDKIDADDVLDKIADMPIQSWQFKSDDPKQRHIGPTSQDFQSAFKLGPDEKTIAPVDGIGVSLVAIKALHNQLDQKNQQVAQLTEQMAGQQERLDQQQKLLEQQQQLLEQFSDRLDDLQEKDLALVVH